VPPKLSLYNDYESTVQFISNIRAIALGQRRRVWLDFDETTQIGPAAMLVLLAEIYRCRKIEANAARVTGSYPADKKLERDLQDAGFYKLLDVRNRLPDQNPSGQTEYIPFVTGTKTVGEVADGLQKALLGPTIHMRPDLSSKLYRGLTEAMTNVVQHAYPPDAPGPRRFKSRWWLVGHIDKQKQQLMVMLFDQGVGIPKTLPKNYNAELITAMLGSLGIITPRHAEFIQAAMALGRSKTKDEHRGRGLQDLRSFVDNAGTGSLTIFSSRGQFEYRAGGKESLTNHDKSLGGTLIEWTVPLAALENVSNGD